MEESQGTFAQCYSVDRFEGVRGGRGLMRERQRMMDRETERGRQTDRQRHREGRRRQRLWLAI